MRDEEYFNDKIFSHINKDLKLMMKDFAKETETKVYIVLDMALREYLEDKGYDVETNIPKKPKIVWLEKEK